MNNYSTRFGGILSRLNLKDERTKSVAGNVLKSFIVKFFSTFVTLALIPISLHYIEKDSYGVWLTIASFITWFSIFDFGLSNGLTNRLSEAFAMNDCRLAKIYLSTTYFILLIVTASLSFTFLLISPFTNWNSIFSTRMDSKVLNNAVYITFFSFIFLFLLKPVTSLLMAKQKHFLASIIQVAGNLTSLILIYLIGPFIINDRFIFLSTSLSFSYPVFLLLFSVYLFNTTYKELRPSIKAVNWSYKRALMGLSFKFFIIQISVIVILTSNNILIAHFVDNSNVTYYNIAYRLYSITAIFQMMFLHPLWAAFNNAYILKDFAWIKNVVAKINKMNLYLCIVLIGMFIFHNSIYKVWIGPSISIPLQVDLLLCIYFLFNLFVQTYVYFINGVGKLNLQTLLSVVTIILQFPLAFFLTQKAHLGISGILMLNIFWAIISLFLWKKQYKVIMSSQETSKIWQ